MKRGETSPAADPKLVTKVKAASVGGKLACAKALRLAGDLGVPPRHVGAACDAAGIKIIHCQLGCFG